MVATRTLFDGPISVIEFVCDAESLEPPPRFLRFQTLHEVRFEQDYDFMNRQVVAGRNHTTSMDWLVTPGSKVRVPEIGS